MYELPTPVTAVGNEQPDSAPWNVHPCAGDDEWCVITVRDDTDWGLLRDVLGDPEWAREEDLATTAGRVARRAEIDAHLTAWTARRPPREATHQLQSEGVPAAFMQRADEYEDDPHLVAREFLVGMEQPGMEPMLVENGPCPRSRPHPRWANTRARSPASYSRSTTPKSTG
jgi:crotonobetainyl-CoA:carnitine CoA-transferase CaiB-like acyl-CoA transferase